MVIEVQKYGMSIQITSMSLGPTQMRNSANKDGMWSLLEWYTLVHRAKT